MPAIDCILACAARSSRTDGVGRHSGVCEIGGVDQSADQTVSSGPGSWTNCRSLTYWSSRNPGGGARGLVGEPAVREDRVDRLKWSLVPGYVISQCLGAIGASGILLLLLKGLPESAYQLQEHGLGANGNPRNMLISGLFGLEVVMTALFLFTIFSATRKDVPAGVTGLAIGGFLFVAHLVGAQLGDSSLNPARSLGPALFVRGEALRILWVFIAAPIVGGAIGLLMFRVAYEK